MPDTTEFVLEQQLKLSEIMRKKAEEDLREAYKLRGELTTKVALLKMELMVTNSILEDVYEASKELNENCDSCRKMGRVLYPNELEEL